MIDLWQKLSHCDKPILLYGMGLGGDKIIDVCEKKGISVSDVFASDGFVRGQSFHGKTVLSYSQAKEKYGDFTVLVSFSSRLPDVIGNILKISDERECYAPDVPVAGGGLFDSEFYETHKAEFDRARELFADERSKKLFDDMINFKLSGDIKLLFNDISTKDEILSDILDPDKYKVCCDMGAYNGDTLREFIADFPNLSKSISFEPDTKNYAKLSKFITDNSLNFASAYNCAAWSRECKMQFSVEGSRNSGIKKGEKNREKGGGKTAEVDCRTLDGVSDGLNVDYIKYDVEGAEREALIGSARTITRCRPDLLVSLYHRNEDLFDLPMLVHSMNPGYSLYLRRFSCIPAWELNLYAVGV